MRKRKLEMRRGWGNKGKRRESTVREGEKIGKMKLEMRGEWGIGGMEEKGKNGNRKTGNERIGNTKANEMKVGKGIEGERGTVNRNRGRERK